MFFVAFSVVFFISSSFVKTFHIFTFHIDCNGCSCNFHLSSFMIMLLTFFFSMVSAIRCYA